MKRLYALLLALTMGLGCAAVAEETADYVGYWVVTSTEINGKTYDPAALGVNAYMELYADGTCLTYVEVGNEVYYADELGVEMTLSIHDGKGVHAVYSGESGEVTDLYNGVCEIEEVTDFGTAMLLLYTDDAGKPDGGGIMLLKFDNEELVWYAIDEYDRSVSYCFVPEAMLEE